MKIIDLKDNVKTVKDLQKEIQKNKNIHISDIEKAALEWLDDFESNDAQLNKIDINLHHWLNPNQEIEFFSYPIFDDIGITMKFWDIIESSKKDILKAMNSSTSVEPSIDLHKLRLIIEQKAGYYIPKIQKYALNAIGDYKGYIKNKYPYEDLIDTGKYPKPLCEEIIEDCFQIIKIEFDKAPYFYNDLIYNDLITDYRFEQSCFSKNGLLRPAAYASINFFSIRLVLDEIERFLNSYIYYGYIRFLRKSA